MMFLSNTDLPVPDGPMMALILPRGTSKVMSCSTVCEPNDFVTPRIEMTGRSSWLFVSGGPAVGGDSGIELPFPVIVTFPFPLPIQTGFTACSHESLHQTSV